MRGSVTNRLSTIVGYRTFHYPALCVPSHTLCYIVRSLLFIADTNAPFIDHELVGRLVSWIIKYRSLLATL